MLTGKVVVITHGASSAVVMYGVSSVIGPATIGRIVWLSAGAAVTKATIPDNSVVFRTGSAQVVRTTNRSVRNHYFGGA